MRKNLLGLVSICLMTCLLWVNQTQAVPAYPGLVQYKQANGKTLAIFLKGDEKVKWATTEDGYTIMLNSNGVYEYAIQDMKGDLQLSGIEVNNIKERTAAEKELLSKVSKGLYYSPSQLSMMKSIWDIKSAEAQKAFPTTGNRKLICILMGFKDKAFTKTQSDFNNLFNQVGYSTGGATGSVKDYYLENSWGQFNLTVDVFGPYTASQNMSYYGANDAYGNDKNPRALVTEAVNAADASANFANYDNDGDGTVDGVYVIYAGYGEEAGASADAIWAHAWSITPVTKDGKTISKYSCSAELRGNSGTTITSIGVICHEFGHVLGAPDYYDTDYSTGGQFEGTGKWDMMASGSWNNNGVTPAHHNAYTKVKVYGWATATVLSSATNVTVKPVKDNKSFFQINSTTSGEYWIMENRQQVGFDAYVPGHGLIIYHVHKDVASASSSNNINATYPQKMYPVCASATTNPGTTSSTYGSINSTGCPFPGSSNKTSFTDATTPNMKSWAGANTGKPMTSIAENATTKDITFAFMGGSGGGTAPTATTVAASSITTSSATLNGTVNANNATTTVTFEWGTTTSLGNSINATPNSVTGTSNTNVTANLTGLSANTKYYYRVKAVSANGTTYGSTMNFTTAVNPTSVTLPYSQTFSSSSMPTGWTTQNTGSGITERWSVSNTNKAGGSAYEMKCTYQNVNPGTTRLITPAINTSGVSQVTLTFRHMLDAYSTGVTLRVQTSNDKTNWTNTSWSVATSSTNINATSVTVNITTNLNSATTYIAFVAEGNLYNIDYWYIDNVSVAAGSGATTPTVTTGSVSNITSSTATVAGNVTADGGATVTERGICYSTSQNPTTANSKVASGSGTGSFSANLSGLAANTTYYARAYAINAQGTSYGSQVSFTTTTSTVTYCASKGSNSSYEWIDLVQFAGINRTSGNDGGYKDMTSLQATVARGTTYTIYFSAGFKSSSYTEYWAVWIDYNKNGTFDTNEKVVSGSSSSSGTLSASITIPTTATLGVTRMRVSMKYNAAPTACETFSYGEVEDYSVNITSGTSAPSTDNPFAEELGNEKVDIFTIYPNPASEKINVVLNGIEGEVSARIYDMRGAVVKFQMLTDRNNTIEINDLAPGVYMISIDDEKQPITKQFIKK
ncbi:MAG: M6 family metalloprotease domain-containing protein [Tenuifilum sp.]|uniref:M6 family metalloprotease domain-containing protein n=3 Tax=Tenuifilaceae TaxID=2760872 RepID=UPI001B4A6E1D|nr:M6 family metalloprotease domain-containing protein [Bacteroidales bacterium]HOK61478.1 M6 family metalloprotease domain-containing protein [Tenuifilum sp.]MBP9028503.1 M6 family metalloprotease domain-containing protein [Bacteroidales bacterium]HOK85370.1 M6 family metalloprotease domain-containing protein [Tenuifilum sp.]HON70178.1 M6 family metalloprotease domain-containing protein [Tenuifilum sp.]